MKNWIKKVLGITKLEIESKHLNNTVDLQRTALNAHRRFVLQKMAELKEYTRVDADIGCRGNNTIILTGVFRGKGFVRFYDLGDGEFKALVEQLRDMKDHSLIRHVDAPPQFCGAFKIQ